MSNVAHAHRGSGNLPERRVLTPDEAQPHKSSRGQRPGSFSPCPSQMTHSAWETTSFQPKLTKEGAPGAQQLPHCFPSIAAAFAVGPTQ